MMMNKTEIAVKSAKLLHMAQRKMNLYHFKKWLWIIVRTLLIVGICFVILWPVIWMLHYSFIDLIDTHDLTVVYIPKHFTLSYFKPAFEYLNYPHAFFNSALLAVTVSVFQLLSCMTTGYGFARFNFRLNKLLFALVVFVFIVPPQTMLVSTYMHYRFFDIFGLIEAIRGKPGILESYWPFWLQAIFASGLKNGLYIIIFRQFFRGMPREIEEAAMVDGMGVFGTYTRIMVPNAKPAIVTVLLFSFVWQWNDSYYASIYMGQSDILPINLANLASTISRALGSTDPYLMVIFNNVGSLLVILPVLILYCILQKQFVESVERTGIVG
jgi:multiple sugar transport system permease protein